MMKKNLNYKAIWVNKISICVKIPRYKNDMHKFAFKSLGSEMSLMVKTNM